MSQTSVPQTAGGQGMGSGGASVEVQTADAEGTGAEGREPKTGDATQVEIYATAAMIAGLTYLLLYFMEEGRGMTEREGSVRGGVYPMGEEGRQIQEVLCNRGNLLSAGVLSQYRKTCGSKRF